MLLIYDLYTHSVTVMSFCLRHASSTELAITPYFYGYFYSDAQ
jgi:hypothetical protein